ncbi:hypothetical protein HED60_19445 [Planctomycetales bacterium ZRK34]|nr:hypothetical protein HED60_19445 [Planctomycetales bacterium ZRK34]
MPDYITYERCLELVDEANNYGVPWRNYLMPGEENSQYLPDLINDLRKEIDREKELLDRSESSPALNEIIRITYRDAKVSISDTEAESLFNLTGIYIKQLIKQGYDVTVNSGTTLDGDEYIKSYSIYAK